MSSPLALEDSGIGSSGLRPLASSAPRVVYLSSLSLTHFRNYAHARLQLTAAPIVLTGSNGAGKTSLLEAVSLLTPGRGLRRAKLSEIDRACQHQPTRDSWVVSARVQGMQGKVAIGTAHNPQDDTRLIKIDGMIVKSQAELARHLSVIWLLPQMEQLFGDGTSAGRKFLDRLVYSFDPEHASRINAYEFAMRERNKILQQDGTDRAWLDALEQTMAERGTAIATARLHTVEHINAVIQRSTLSFPKADIRIGGALETLLSQGATAVQTEGTFKTQLRDARRADAAAGRALIGTHRSEMQVMHIEKQMMAPLCSTGEQKALLLSIILAQARAGSQWHGVIPVILLDEVVAHLDKRRRQELYQEICDIDAQTWMTGTDARLFADLEGRAQFAVIEKGEIGYRESGTLP